MARLSLLPDLGRMKVEKPLETPGQRKVWIDLDNSPHVPFFAPIVEELEKRGYAVLLTARDCSQVFGLVDFYSLTCKRLGRHYGKNKILKLVGLCLRALQMLPTVVSEKPDLALSHGSRAQLLLSTMLGIPSLMILDYEFARVLNPVRPSWVMVPEVIPETAAKRYRTRVLRYPGIKEDVYVPRFKPDPTIKAHLGLDANHLVVTVRPPASDAHYHNPESDRLFAAVIDFLGRNPDIRMVLLPRNEKQATSVRKLWPELFATGTIIIPEHVVDGLNLIWYSDLVISGGGTMNREAAALGVPVYSIFRGKIGAVDQYLADRGQLILLESVQDIQTKIILARRNAPAQTQNRNSPALQSIVDQIAAVMER